jgi:hypothetical protein
LNCEVFSLKKNDEDYKKVNRCMLRMNHSSFRRHCYSFVITASTAKAKTKAFLREQQQQRTFCTESQTELEMNTEAIWPCFATTQLRVEEKFVNSAQTPKSKKLQHNHRRRYTQNREKTSEKLELCEQLEENHPWMHKQKNVRSRSAQS